VLKVPLSSNQPCSLSDHTPSTFGLVYVCRGIMIVGPLHLRLGLDIIQGHQNDKTCVVVSLGL